MNRFLEAVSRGNPLIVKHFIDSKDISLTEIRNGLILSSQRGFKDIMQLLLKDNSKNIQNSLVSKEILENVIKNNHSTCLKFMIKDKNIMQENSLENLLQYSLKESSDLKIVRILFKEISREKFCNNQDLLLQLLEFISLKKFDLYGKLENTFLYQILVDLPDISQEYIIKNLIRTGRKRHLLKYLLLNKKITNLHFEDDYLFRKACKIGDKDLIQLLLNHYDVDVDARNSEGVKVALQYKHLDIVDLLKKHAKN